MAIWTCGWRTAGGKVAEVDVGYVGMLLLLLAVCLAGCFLTIRALKRGYLDGEIWVKQVLIRKTDGAGTFWFAMVIAWLGAAFFVVSVPFIMALIVEAITGVPVLG